MKHYFGFSPFSLPILAFGLTIAAGAILLHAPASLSAGTISWMDALFTATSATCVTGLTVVDTGTHFSRFGQGIILGLIQVGGLGIMTYTSLIFYLWRRRVTLTDRIAVGQSLLHDPGFNLGKFLTHMVFWTFCIEIFGALSLYLQSPKGFPFFSAVFHAVSAFCNAGFSLQENSLMAWQGTWGINLSIIVLIVLGGLGFSVLMELFSWLRAQFLRWRNPSVVPKALSWYALIILRTSLFLIILGWALLYLAEFVGYHRKLSLDTALLATLFQSVTCRTAGFNTLNIGQMTNMSLLIMMGLMFIGGGPASCAGGIKISTFRVLIAFIMAQLRGAKQTRLGRYAVSQESLNKALMLFVFGTLIVIAATFVLTYTEGGDIPHPQARGLDLEILFEVISAFATVGLSTGLTPGLSVAGKGIITLLMFIGRLGPILFLMAIQRLQEEQAYMLPEENLLIG